MAARKAQRYDENDIEVFVGLEGIRRKPSMYLGDMNEAPWTCVREIADNCQDEWMAGRNDSCLIVYDGDYVWVADKGNGIPVNEKKIKQDDGTILKESTLTSVVSRIHAGGKFNANAYKTSAGCFVGDTPLQLLNGETVTFESLYKDFIESGCMNSYPIASWCTKKDRLTFSNISNVVIAKWTKKLVDVKLSSGEVIRCTPDHPFYIRSGSKIIKVEANKLATGMSCVARHTERDSDEYLVDTTAKSQRGGQYREHRQVYQFYNPKTILDPTSQIHHKDGNRKNNEIGNLELLTSKEHQLEHWEEKSILATELVYANAKLRKSNSKKFRKQNVDPEFIGNSLRSKILRSAMRAYHHTKTLTTESYTKYRMHGSPGYSKAISIWGSKSDLKKQVKHELGIIYSRSENYLWDSNALDWLNLVPDNISICRDNSHIGALVSLARKAKANGLTPSTISAKAFAKLKYNGNFSSYAKVVGYTKWENFKRYFTTGDVSDIVLHDDRTDLAIYKRMCKGEAKFRSKASMLHVVQLGLYYMKNLSTIDEPSYNEVKASNSPNYYLVTAFSRKLYNLESKQEFDDFVRSYNYSIVSVTAVTLDEKVPVYDITVDRYHTFFVNGVLVSNTHGVGMSAVNAVSAEFDVWTCREKQWYHTAYAKGKETSPVSKVKAPLIEKVKYKATKGTVIRFKLDASVFPKGAKFDESKAHDWAEFNTYLNAEFKVVVVGQKTKPITYYHPEGLWGLIEKTYLQQRQGDMSWDETVGDTNVNLEIPLGNGSNMWCDYAFIMAPNVEGVHLSLYTNGVYNPDGGVHQEAFWSSLMKALAEFAPARSSYSVSDIKEGVIGIINVKINEPQFNNQTKEKLVDPRIKKPLEQALYDDFYEFFRSNKAFVKDLCNRASELNALRGKVAEQRRALLTIKKASNVKPAKFANVVGNVDKTKIEIFPCEGDSAGGTAKQARYKNFQAVLPLKGKPLNAMKAEDAKVLVSEEVLNIFNCIGYIPDGKSTPDGFGKIILLSDSDVDGYHINALVLTIIQKYMPELFEQEKVFVVDTRNCKVYGKSKSGNYYFGRKPQDVIDQAKEAKDPIVGKPSYLKGWGELDPAGLRIAAMNPATRKLIKLTGLSRKQVEQFEALMGKDTAFRKALVGVEN